MGEVAIADQWEACLSAAMAGQLEGNMLWDSQESVVRMAGVSLSMGLQLSVGSQFASEASLCGSEALKEIILKPARMR